jgi:single-strand DNA-binding protein
MINEVTLIGNLGADPDARFTASGEAVTELRLATSEGWTDKKGEKQEHTEWHRIIVWGKAAENCAKYLKKGSRVYVKGSIRTRSYDDKEGNKRYVTEIKAFDVQFLDSAKLGSREIPDKSAAKAEAKMPTKPVKRTIKQLPED